MPDVEPLRFPSREGRPSQQDQADFQFACTGRRRPCVLLNSPSPCVNKAVYHIQELRKTVEQWCQQSQTDQDKKCSKTLRLEPRDSDTESVTELFVEGIAICPRAYNTVGQSLKVFHPPESCPLSPLLKKINDVLGEVVYLIEQLEADRQYAEEAIQKEKTRKRFLESKIDSISLWKKQEHSFVVQKEHEACIRDNTELKWQLKLERQKLQQNQEKLSHTEVLNQRLHEDISFAKKQIPIVKENLDFQRDIINQINTAQVEADEEYSKTQSDLKMAQKEFQKFKLDANTEQKSQDSELFETKAQLAKRLEAVNNLKVYDEGLYAQIKDAEKVVALTEEKCEAITQHIPEMMELEKTEKDQSLQLKLRFEDEVQKNKKLKKKLSALQEDIEKTKLNREAEVSCIEEQLHTKRNTFALLHKENMVYEQNLEDFKTKISKSEKAVKQMREEKKQMLQKITDNDEQWEKAKEEATQVAAQHSVTQTKLKEQEQLTLIEQQRARKEIETLRKDLTSQMTEMEVLKGQCATISEELKHRQRSSELTNQKLQKEFEDASSATKALESKILNIKKLTEHLERIQCEHRNMLDNLEKEKKLKGDHLRVAKDLHTTTIRSYDSTLGRISDLTKKIEEYRDASDKMEKTVENMTEVIAELQSVFDVVDFRNKSAALIMSTLKSDINNCQQRTQRSVQTHTAHVTARKMKMEHTKEALKIALEENKRLAKEYECFKKILMEARQEAVSALSKKNHEQSSFHYYTQLSLLQKRMHKALVKYFKQRSLYSQAELDRCQALSQETDQKIKTAQDGLSEEIQLISAFLESLTDDSATTDDAGVNKQANPDAAGSNE